MADEYLVAIVRFSETGRKYPVNCNRLEVKPGDRVIVRLVKQNKRMQAAFVVEFTQRNSACINGIVCLESEVEEYGAGPHGITSLEDLERFLHFNRWDRFETVEPVGLFDDQVRPSRWAYTFVQDGFRNLGKFSINRVEMLHMDLSVHVSPITEVKKIVPSRHGRFAWSKRLMTCTDENKLVLTNSHSVVLFPPSREIQHYREVAEFIEGSLAFNMSEPEDNSLDEIRSMVGGDDGAAAYLGDDVWI